jgi:hypothetical protein
MIDKSLEVKFREIVKKHMQKMADDFKTIQYCENPFYNLFPSRASELGRSFDSRMGTVIENIAFDICKLNYDEVSKYVVGELFVEQCNHISQVLSKYENKETRTIPEISDYSQFQVLSSSKATTMRKKCDICVRDGNKHYIIEVKLGGDMDNKKSQSEKKNLLERYFIKTNELRKLNQRGSVKIFLGTAYNCCGEDEFNQARVLQYFNRKELLIGKEFWNFIARSEEGAALIWDEFIKCCSMVDKAYSSAKECIKGKCQMNSK